MQKEEKIMVVLLVMAVLSLTIGYLGFVSQVSADSAYSVYSADSITGNYVYVEGTVLSKQMTAKGDNLVLSISDLNVKVFISKDKGAKEVYNNLKTGDNIRINGKVAEYKNAREIIVESASDVKKL